jgi:two-component system cell cycle sensor histidine kinase/response regulator CckA
MYYRMRKAIRVLLVKGQEGYAERILHELKWGGFDPIFKHVDCQCDYLRHLTADLDVILADYDLPGFDGMTALDLLRDSGLNVPLILAVERSDEDLVTAAIAKGAADCVIRDRFGRLALAVTRVLEQKRLREQHRVLMEQLRQSQKMEILGMLASGVAHDLNNLLTVISGNCSCLLADLGARSPRRRYLEEIEKATECATALTHQLVAFSRRQPTRPKGLNLNSVIAEMAGMLHRLIRENIRLVTVPATDLKQVRIDPSQIAQVLMNLTINARDAMSDGGTLTITTQNVDLKEGELGPGAEIPVGDCVLLTVTDSGIGISETIMTQIFEPFFTTKPAPDRSGLGLAICHSIVKQSGGQIAVRSAVGRGTTFLIYLPCARES